MAFWLDETGVIRVGGRLQGSSLNFNVKHPIVLPKKGNVSKLIVRHFHQSVSHQGRGITSNEIRANGFWILGCSTLVKAVIQSCVKCKKCRGAFNQQKMSDLPNDRTEPTAPFTYCGLDCFGPWYVKEGRKTLKRYGVLFPLMLAIWEEFGSTVFGQCEIY